MTKWEYLRLSMDVDKGKPRWVNGEELPNWKNEGSVIQYCNRLGDQGWEAISEIVKYYSGGGVMEYWILFKRPKQ
jgi:hypothetical protein